MLTDLSKCIMIITHYKLLSNLTHVLQILMSVRLLVFVKGFVIILLEATIAPHVLEKRNMIS